MGIGFMQVLWRADMVTLGYIKFVL